MFYRFFYSHLFATTSLSCLLLLSLAANLQASNLISTNPLYSLLGRFLPACSVSCQNGASCNEAMGRCVCRSGYFGDDCSGRAAELANNEAAHTNLASHAWAYYYYTLDDDKEVKISIDSNISPITVALIFSDSSFILPPTRENSYSFVQNTNSRNVQFTLSKKQVKQLIGQDALVGIYNPTSQGNTIKIKASTSGSNILTIVLIVIGVLSVILNIIGCIYYIKYKMRRELLAALREQQQREERAAFSLQTHFGQIRIQNFSENNNNNNQNGHQGVVDLDASLTQEDLNMYFPQTKFESLKTPFGQAECPICLEEYPKESMCRQLYCGHIFHTNCIQFWLAKHKACPNCKKSMTRMAIGEFYEKRRNGHPIEEQHEDDEQRGINQPEAEAERESEEENNVVIDIGQALRMVENQNELQIEEEKNDESHSQTQNVLNGNEEEPKAPEGQQRLEATHLEVIHLSAEQKDGEPNIFENVENKDE